MENCNIDSLSKQMKTDSVPKFTQICRVCLCETKNGDPKIDATLLMFYKPQQIKTMIQESTGIKIVDNDSLPKHICDVCLKTLRAWYKFRSQMQRTDEILKEYLKNHNTKLDSTSVPSNNLNLDMQDGEKMNVVPAENIQQIDGFEVTIVKEKTERKEFLLQCDSCTMTFTNQLDLEKHSEEHIKKTPKENSTKCEYCGKTFSFAHGLLNHTQIYHSGYKNQNFQCGSCERVFRTPRCLKNHQNKPCVSLELIEQCKIRPTHLPLEELIEAGEKAIRETKISCILCKENFENHDAFVSHYPKHYNSLHCPICKKDLKRVKLLEQHVRMHLREKVYTCPICTRSFYARDSMRVHIKNHTKNELVYKCNVCQKDFFKVREFEKHMRKHLTAAAKDTNKKNDNLDTVVEMDDDDNIEIDNECDSNNSDEDDEMTIKIEPDSPKIQETCTQFLKEEIFSDEEISNRGEGPKTIEIKMEFPPIDLIDSEDQFQIIKTESDMPMESYNSTDFDDSNKIQTEFLNTTKVKSEVSDLSPNVKLEKSDFDVSAEEDQANESDDNLPNLSKSNNKMTDSETEKYFQNLLDLVKVKCHVPDCQTECSSFQNTMLHFTNEHLANMESPFECVICCEKFKNKKLIKEHTRKYYTFKCPVCLKLHKTFSKLSKHVRCSHLSDRFRCSICDKRFGLPGNLKVHMTTHSQKKLFVCNICQKEFYSSNGLYLHSKSHMVIKELQCRNCGRQVASKSRLMKHTANCVRRTLETNVELK